MAELNLPDTVLLPDGQRGNALIVGQMGSGKTWGVTQLVRSTSPGPHHRFVFVCPKNEGFMEFCDLKKNPPHSNPASVLRNIEKQRYTVWWPDLDLDDAGMMDQFGEIVRGVIKLRKRNPESSFTLVLDETQEYIPGSSSKLPKPIRMLARMSRSMMIRPVFMSQYLIVHPHVDSQVSDVLVWPTAPMDAGRARTRYGYDHEEVMGNLSRVPYSFAWLNLFAGHELMYMAPVAGP